MPDYSQYFWLVMAGILIVLLLFGGRKPPQAGA